MSKAYPLHWPKEWPRTKCPGSSQFRTSISAALKNVEKSVELFAKDSGRKVTGVVISSNVTLGEQRPKDPGVAVYFTWDEISTCIAVDRYSKVEDNLQAIHHVLEAERVKLRHGGLNLVRAAFRGYAALPPPSTQPPELWQIVLQVSPEADADTVKRAYQKRRKETHPDQGGNAVEFDKVQKAWQEYLRRHAL